MQNKILLIHKEGILTTCITQLLKEEGYEVKFLNNGKNAQLVISEFGPDLIICDLQTPYFKSITLDRCLTDNLGQKAPFIIVSKVNNDKVINHAYSIGASSCLHHPLDLKNLVSTIEGLLSKKNTTINIKTLAIC